MIDAWAIKQPSVQALPCPQVGTLACAVWLVACGFTTEGSALVLCFCGLLRISEALSLHIKDLYLSAEGARPACILLLGQTKRGREQRIVLINVGVVSWVKWVIKLRSCTSEQEYKLLPTPYK